MMSETMPSETCRHEDLQTIMSNAWIQGEKLYSIRCRNCGAMTEFCFTVGEARKRFKLGIFGHVETEDR